mmetsp:Transcript_25391/g.76254  ORF Transcript_25391/g.76254 Transcript_25391/m.76254 type:complete len:209 (-) Transcript_25391:37-663(-)
MARMAAAALLLRRRPTQALRALSSSAAPPEGFRYLPDFFTAEEQAALVAVTDARLARKRYERDHWDSVIDNYREAELSNAVLTMPARAAVDKARQLLADDYGAHRFLPPHCIDLSEKDGVIRPHVDSVKFSGGLVAGASLLAAATLRLAPADPETGEARAGAEFYDVRLEPGSFYVLSGPARFDWAHAVVELEGRRLSVMFRDEVGDW